MTTKAPPEISGGAFVSPQHVISDSDALIINRRGRQQRAKARPTVVYRYFFPHGRTGMPLI